MPANKLAKNIGVVSLAREHGIDPMRVIGRLHCGWTLEKALNTPVRHLKRSFILKTGETLHSYCVRNGLGEKEYNRCRSLIKEKCLTVDEALVYHRKPKDPEWRKKKTIWLRLNRYGYSKKEADLPDCYYKRKGIEKQSKYFYKGKTLHEYCLSDRVNISYSTIRKIVKHYKIGVSEAIYNYRKGMTYTSYKHSKYERRISYK